MREFLCRLAAGAAFALVFVVVVQPAFGLSIRPAILDVEIQPGEHQTGVVTVANPGGEEDRFRVAVAHFRLSRDGEVEPAPPDSYAVSEWIKFNPREFVLERNAQQQIRYTLMVPADAKAGDYWGVMEFTQLTMQTVTANDTVHGRNVSIKVASAIIVPIFVKVGKVTYEWSLVDVQARVAGKRAAIAVTLRNASNGRVPFQTEVDIVSAGGDVIAHQAEGEISLFPFSERVVTLPLDSTLNPGDYTVRARVSSRKVEGLLAGESTLHIPPGP